MVFNKINIISVKQTFKDLKAYLPSKVMFSKMNIYYVNPKAIGCLFCPILLHRIKIGKQFEMENTNMCQDMNSPSGEIKLSIILTTGDKEIFAILNFCLTEI